MTVRDSHGSTLFSQTTLSSTPEQSKISLLRPRTGLEPNTTAGPMKDKHTVPLVLSNAVEVNGELGSDKMPGDQKRTIAVDLRNGELMDPSSESDTIPVVLQQTDSDGQYTLDANDRDLQVLLKEGLRRSKSGIPHPKKSQFRDIMLKKQFTAFDRLNTGELPSFHGFFTLFWIGVTLMIVRVAANNWRTEGSVLGKNEIVRLMLSKDLMLLGVVDCLMMSAGLVSTFIQVLVYRDWISWGRSGWILQNIWQFTFLCSFIGFSRVRDWPWTHAVFITLHTITMLMKQHSYAFYNGHLSEVSKRRMSLQKRLDFLKEPTNMAPSSPLLTAHATSYFDMSDLSEMRRRRRHSAGSTTIPEKDESLAGVIEAIQADKALSHEQLLPLRRLISQEIDSLTEELKGTCKTTTNYYPHNLSILDWFNYIPLPTVVYELEYPRDPRIRWSYVLEKVAATFGTLFVMIIVSTAYIYPVVLSTLKMKIDGVPLQSRLQEFPWTFLDLLFPLMMEYLLSW